MKQPKIRPSTSRSSSSAAATSVSLTPGSRTASSTFTASPPRIGRLKPASAAEIPTPRSCAVGSGATGASSTPQRTARSQRLTQPNSRTGTSHHQARLPNAVPTSSKSRREMKIAEQTNPRIGPASRTARCCSTRWRLAIENPRMYTRRCARKRTWNSRRRGRVSGAFSGLGERWLAVGTPAGGSAATWRGTVYAPGRADSISRLGVWGRQWYVQMCFRRRSGSAPGGW
jgi:hypothetical protein